MKSVMNNDEMKLVKHYVASKIDGDKELTDADKEVLERFLGTTTVVLTEDAINIATTRTEATHIHNFIAKHLPVDNTTEEEEEAAVEDLIIQLSEVLDL